MKFKSVALSGVEVLKTWNLHSKLKTQNSELRTQIRTQNLSQVTQVEYHELHKYILVYPFNLCYLCSKKTQNSKLRTQNSELRTQNSELKTQNSKLIFQKLPLA